MTSATTTYDDLYDIPFAPNWDLLEQCFETIIGDSERWYQGSWVDARDWNEIPENMRTKVEEGADAHCGTTACLAGHAMIKSGEWQQKITTVYRDEYTGKPTGFEVELVNKKTGKDVWDEFNNSLLANSGGVAHSVYGSQALGLDYYTASKLFTSTGWDSTEAPDFVHWVREVIANRAQFLGVELPGNEAWAEFR